jgi:hypothetical protein
LKFEVAVLKWFTSSYEINTPLGNVFEAMMEKGQDQIPDEGFLMTKKPMYFIVTVDKILMCLGVLLL